jgi:PAS domain S-box-containing protein
VDPVLPSTLAKSNVKRANAGLFRTQELLLPMAAPFLARLVAFGIRLLRDRRWTEEELGESRRRFEGSFENASIGMALVAPDGAWLDVNPALCRLVGYGRDELLRLTFQDITHPDDIEADLGNARELLAGRAETYQTEKRYFRKDGAVVWVLLSVSLVRNPKGMTPYFVSQIQDITDRKEAEEQVRALNRTLEERVFLRTAQLAERERRLEDLVGKLIAAQEEERRRVAYEVHDGPTQIVIATHHLLQAFADAHPPGATVEAGALDRPLELARTAVKEARRIIEGLRPTALDDFGLAAALRLLIEDLRAEGWEAGYEDTLGDERLPTELETALYRVAREALNNVRKHAGTRKTRLALARADNAVRLTVRDWGAGFDVVADGTSAVGRHGERVGLSGMRERISLLGGAFRVESKPGSGTRLTAELPLPATGEAGQDERPANRGEKESASS